jgi:hypothetical protein
LGGPIQTSLRSVIGTQRPKNFAPLARAVWTENGKRQRTSVFKVFLLLFVHKKKFLLISVSFVLK